MAKSCLCTAIGRLSADHAGNRLFLNLHTFGHLLENFMDALVDITRIYSKNVTTMPQELSYISDT